MKVRFFIKIGYTYGLNLVLERKITRFFSSVNLALTPLSSSEDDTLLPDDLHHLPANLECDSAEQTGKSYAARNCATEALTSCSITKPYATRNYVAHEFTFHGSMAPTYEELGDAEMEVIKSVLEVQELGFAYGVNVEEEDIIRVLNVLYYEGGSAALSLRFFMWSEFSLGLKHTVRAVCTLIHILVLGNMCHRAVDLITSLIRGYPQQVQPRQLIEVLQQLCVGSVLQVIYSMLVRCYIMEDMIGEAFEAICLMKEVGLFPSVGVCNSLINFLLGHNLEDLAWGFLEEMQGRRLVSTTTMSLFIHYYCHKDNLKCGWKLLMDMRHYGIQPDVIAYTTFIHFLCKLSYIKEATCFLYKMIEMGISPDSVLLASIIDGYCKVARPGDAICVIKNFDVQPNTFVYNSFISKLSKDGDMEQAFTLFQEMTNLGIFPDCFSYTTMIDGYCKASIRRKALEYLGRMLKDGIEPSVTTYSILIASYCRSGDMETAWHLVQKMIRKGLVLDTAVYNTLIDGYSNKGEVHKGLELLDHMKSSGVIPDSVTYNTIIHGLVVSGFLLKANDLLEELTRKGFYPDVVTFTNIIAGYANRRQFKEAFSVWSFMSEKNIRPDVITCNALITGYCRARRMDEASTLFYKMLGAGLVPDIILYNTLIHGFCRAGNIEEACHLINLMVKNNISPNDVTYRALVLGYEKQGMRDPMEIAAHKLELLLQQHGINADI
ncbi:pentatricopeptide repeat-containing protein At2g19280 [Beta vulgaris subsp. vulgaris]|uniref:pentatricopeptide repeat-containing protein At2g19280 n=1 Tax=Beta vulgaris subsp. vulgaris TaxID=3555 RepID=UPI0020367B6E|nr:pentatricopeptide repeat-containing protein At2g19280 [Beta vulgaris subsp. vulgaris]